MAITFPNVTNATAHNGTLSVPITIPSTTAGNLLIVGVLWDDIATGITITDGGDAVTDSGLGIHTDFGNTASIVQAFLSVGAGRTTVTLTFTGSAPTFGDCYVWEVAGITSPVFDKILVGTGNSAGPADSGASGTLGASSEAAIGLGVPAGSGFTTPGTGWSSDGIGGSTGSIGEHQILSSNASINATANLVSSQGWAMWLATFMAAPAGDTLLGQAVF